jgi:hypothetical protein
MVLIGLYKTASSREPCFLLKLLDSSYAPLLILHRVVNQVVNTASREEMVKSIKPTQLNVQTPTTIQVVMDKMRQEATARGLRKPLWRSRQ